MTGGVTIGELARRSGVATSALRFYESKGLIHADRTEAGHRRYLRSALRRIAFIVFAQRIGLSLDEVAAELAKLPQNRVPDAADWSRLAGGWSARIDARIAELQRLKAGLTGCIGCGCLSLETCALANPGDRAARRGPGPSAWGGMPGGALTLVFRPRFDDRLLEARVLNVPLRSLRVLAACGLLLTAGCAPAVAPPPVAAPAAAAPASATPLTLSIVGTNDLHGGLIARDGRGGVALLGGYVKNLRAARARDGGAVLLIDAGDMFQGTLESNIGEGAAVVAAYNALGYSAAAIGNHEFDFGPVGKAATPRTPTDDPRGALRARAAEARFPFLAANLIETASGAPPAWTNVRPTTLVDVAGIKVGIVGVMTLEALTATIAGNVGGLSVAPLVDTIRTHAAALRAQGADVVIVAAHAGGRCSAVDRPDDLSSCNPDAEILAVARGLPRGLVDVIVAGHTHAGMAHQVEGIAITEAYSNGRAFGRVDLTIDRRTRTVVGRRSFPPHDLCEREDPATKKCGPRSNAALVPIDYEGAPVAPDAAIERVLAPALEAVRALKAQPIGIVLETPIRRLLPASPLGNLVTDAYLAAVPGADVAMNNSSGGLRADLPAGPLTYGGVFEVMPFDNLLVSLRITGRQLRDVFAASILQGRRGLGFSGIRVEARCDAGMLAVTMTRPSGAAIADGDTLLLVTSDFLATGGDGILSPIMPPGGFPVDAGAPLARDVLIDSLRRPGAPVREAQLLDATPRLSVSGPMPCVAN